MVFVNAYLNHIPNAIPTGKNYIDALDTKCHQLHPRNHRKPDTGKKHLQNRMRFFQNPRDFRRLGIMERRFHDRFLPARFACPERKGSYTFKMSPTADHQRTGGNIRMQP